MQACDYIGGRFVPIRGDGVVSRNPASPEEVIWRGGPRPAHVDEAIAAARRALPAWSAQPLEQRAACLQRWREVTTAHAERLAGVICDEMGKIMSECRAEVAALAAKVDITLDEVSLARVRDYRVGVAATREGLCRFKPHGVMAVLGPFNLPAHLPNGHFVPALLLGNTIVFKPSEKTPAVGQHLAELAHEAGFPPGVFNVVQGGPDIAAALVAHDSIDGILFTGSWPVGRKILEANLDRPGRIIALEMGGSNPALVLDDADLRQAVIECARAAFATTGQRCTCTRRIIVQESIAERFVPALCKAASTLLIGPGRSSEPVFMGPLVSDQARRAILEFQSALRARGARVLVEASAPDHRGYFLSPGVVAVDRFTLESDGEAFGPIVQISAVSDLEEAIAQANATRFGLAASVFTSSDDAFEACFREIRSGCINRNTGTAGASSKLPFGGLGRSGNHRPAAAFSVDYCAYPVASLIEASAEAPLPPGLYLDERWLSPAPAPSR
jgi:succinylglutamic semialdehyde dehydrogenase